jgi:hypothetical protein
MARGGDWIVPHLAYVPYFEKPILAYWAEAAAQLLFGGSPIAARVPSMVAALCDARAHVTRSAAQRARLRVRSRRRGAARRFGGVFELTGTAVTTDPLFAAVPRRRLVRVLGAIAARPGNRVESGPSGRRRAWRC